MAFSSQWVANVSHGGRAERVGMRYVTQETGIRMALGARVPDVTRMVISQGLRLILVGLAVGLLGAILLGRVLASMEFMLYDVGPTDPLTLAGVPVLLTAVAVFACYMPARKAARIDPMTALRCE